MARAVQVSTDYRPVASPKKARASEEARTLRSKPQGVLGAKV